MSRWLPALLLLVSACAGPSALPSAPPADPSSAPPSASSPAAASGPSSGSAAASQSFSAFVASLRAARYQDYAPPKSEVESETAFEAMRGYLLARYEHVQVPRSYPENGTVLDCMPATAPANGTGCPAGYAPQRRLTLADLTRFPTLAAFLGRAPGGGKVPPTPPPA